MISLSFLIFSLFIVGCSHEQPHNEALAEAEKIVYTHPDKVVRMLAPHYNDTQGRSRSLRPDLHRGSASQRIINWIGFADTS